MALLHDPLAFAAARREHDRRQWGALVEAGNATSAGPRPERRQGPRPAFPWVMPPLARGILSAVRSAGFRASCWEVRGHVLEPGRRSPVRRDAETAEERRARLAQPPPPDRWVPVDALSVAVDLSRDSGHREYALIFFENRAFRAATVISSKERLRRYGLLEICRYLGVKRKRTWGKGG